MIIKGPPPLPTQETQNIPKCKRTKQMNPGGGGGGEIPGGERKMGRKVCNIIKSGHWLLKLKYVLALKKDKRSQKNAVTASNTLVTSNFTSVAVSR